MTKQIVEDAIRKFGVDTKFDSNCSSWYGVLTDGDETSGLNAPCYASLFANGGNLKNAAIYLTGPSAGSKEEIGFNKFWEWCSTPNEYNPWRSILKEPVESIRDSAGRFIGFHIPEHLLGRPRAKDWKNWLTVPRTYHHFQSHWKAWLRMVESGVRPDVAYLLCTYLHIDDGNRLEFRTVHNLNHWFFWDTLDFTKYEKSLLVIESGSICSVFGSSIISIPQRVRDATTTNLLLAEKYMEAYERIKKG